MMKMLLPVAAIVWLLVSNSLEGKILILDATRAGSFSSVTVPGEVNTPKSLPDYQSGALAKLGSCGCWSDEAATFGPLTLGLLLLMVPMRFSRSKSNLEAAQLRAEGNNLRRIGQSWDPRF